MNTLSNSKIQELLSLKLRQILDSKFRQFLDSKVQKYYCKIQFNWILHIKSKPLTVSQKSAMVFAPHQDDETFGCGGMIALKREQKTPVQVIFMTDGRHGNPGLIAEEKTIDVRQDEATDALAHLGVTSSAIHFLNYPDQALNNLDDVQHKEIIINLVELLKSFQPKEVYVPYYQDCQSDHEATYKLVSEAIAISDIEIILFQYPIWILWQKPWLHTLNLPNKTTVFKISIAHVKQQKKQAIASYRSQMKILSADFINLFSSAYEIFIKD